MNPNRNLDFERAKRGDKDAINQILDEFLPLVAKYQYIDGKADEDLYCELCLAAWKCIIRFRVNEAERDRFITELLQS